MTNAVDNLLRLQRIAEQTVPLFLNVPLRDVPEDRVLRNFDVYDVALNHAG